MRSHLPSGKPRVVLVVQEITPDALPGEAVETEAPNDRWQPPHDRLNRDESTASAARHHRQHRLSRATQTARPTPSSASTSHHPQWLRAAPAGTAGLHPMVRPAQLVRSQTQSQLQSAWSALRQGDAARAQALYQQVLASRPDDPDATLGLAVSLHRQRQLEAAWVAYQRSLQMWPDNETARTGMLAILSESDPDTAESRLQEWVQSRPRDAAAQAALGNCWAGRGVGLRPWGR
jgi:tetratricopeptide (TPR) repeat protein